MDNSVKMNQSKVKELFQSTNPMDHVTAARKALDHGSQFIDDLIALLDAKFYESRAYSAKTLGQLEYSPAIEFMIPLLEDEVEEVRYSVAEALGHFIDDRVILPLLMVLSDHSREARRLATSSLANQSSQLLHTNIRDWLSNIHQEDYEMETENSITKIDVTRGIMESCSEFTFKWVPSVLKFGIQSPDLEMKRLTAISIGNRSDQEFLDELLELQDHDDDDLRLAIIYGLTNLEFDSKLTTLLAHFDDDFEFIRELLAGHLPQNYPPHAIDDVIRYYMNDDIGFVRAAVASSLDNPVYFEQLKELLVDPYASVRKAAVKCIANIDDPQSIEILTSHEEEDELVQIAITNAIQQLDNNINCNTS